jgi:hypothetical protein
MKIITTFVYRIIILLPEPTRACINVIIQKESNWFVSFYGRRDFFQNMKYEFTNFH